MPNEVEDDLDVNNLSDSEFMALFEGTDLSDVTEIEEDTPEEVEEESVSESEEEPEEEEEGEETEEPEVDEKISEKDKGDVELPADVAKIFKPFKANGVEMTIDSPNDVITLMQKGANYESKMATLKPHMRRVQMLDNNKISDEDLSLLVDLKKGDQSAIKKLLKDVELDPIDLDLDDVPEYEKKDYGVSEQAYAFNEVVEGLKESEHFKETIAIAGAKWDEASRTAIMENPELLKGLHDHLANGTYTIVKAEVERQRVLDKLPPNLSDLDAYVSIWRKLHSEETTADDKGTSNTNGEGEAPNKGKQRAAKAAAASTTSRRASSSKETSVDIDSMSDEEFAKFLAKNPILDF